MPTAPVRRPEPLRRPEPPRSSPARPEAGARHRKRSLARPAKRDIRGWAGAVALWAVAVFAIGWIAVEYGGALAPAARAGAWLVKATGQLVTWSGAWGSPGQVVSAAVANSTAGNYQNPLRGVSGLASQRIDDGVDFAGAGPVYAIGNAVVTSASATNFGWPGGGWITYRLTDGPGAGLVVYVAEDITPAVTVGQRVSSATVIGNMWNGLDGIETGWAQPTGLSAESELAVAGGIGGLGPFPTRVGVNFDELLISLGVRAAPNVTQSPFGILPGGYPPNW